MFKEKMIQGAGNTYIFFHNSYLSQYVLEGKHPSSYWIEGICSIKTLWFFVSLNEALGELGEMIFDSLYDKASEQEKKVLYLFSHEKVALSKKEVFDLSIAYKLNLTENTINTTVRRLLSKGLLINPVKAKYSLLDEFFRQYILKIKGIDGEGSIQEVQNVQK